MKDRSRTPRVLDVEAAKRYTAAVCRSNPCHGRLVSLSRLEKVEEVHEFCRHTMFGKRQTARPTAIGHSAVTA